MPGKLTILFVLLALFFAASSAVADELCQVETENFEQARAAQILSEQRFSALQRRLAGEDSALSLLRNKYARRRSNLLRLRAKAVADAAVAASACALYSPSACRRLASLSRRISSLQTRLALLPAQERAALARQRRRISRLDSDSAQALADLQQASLVYIRSFSALNQCLGY